MPPASSSAAYPSPCPPGQHVTLRSHPKTRLEERGQQDPSCSMPALCSLLIGELLRIIFPAQQLLTFGARFGGTQQLCSHVWHGRG